MFIDIPMPIPEVADRYTIARLKAERLPEENSSLLLGQVQFYRRGLNLLDWQLASLVEQLYAINGAIWDAEHAIRKGQEEGLGLEEVGRRALRVRDLNCQRTAIKNEIADLTDSGFKDVKMNYAMPLR